MTSARLGQLWMGMGRSEWFREKFEERSHGATDGLDGYTGGQAPATGGRFHGAGVGDVGSLTGRRLYLDEFGFFLIRHKYFG